MPALPELKPLFEAIGDEPLNGLISKIDAAAAEAPDLAPAAEIVKAFITGVASKAQIVAALSDAVTEAHGLFTSGAGPSEHSDSDLV